MSCCDDEDDIEIEVAEIVAGEDAIFFFEYFQSDGETALDITGADFKSQMRRQPVPTGDLIDEWAEGDPEITRDDLLGIVTLKIPGAVTQAYAFGTAYLDAVLQYSQGPIRSDVITVALKTGPTDA